jgi:chemotaxis protein MotB
MRRARTEQALAGYRDLVGRFQAMIDAGTLKVKVLHGRLMVELATDILFPPGKATLSKEGKAAITEVAQVLNDIPGRDYQVGGHTDNVPIATERFPSNWHLGAARAIAVSKLLVSAGLAPVRVSAASYSDSRPVDTNRTSEGKANNRRIEIAIVPDLSMMPGYAELEQLGKGQAPIAPAPVAPVTPPEAGE